MANFTCKASLHTGKKMSRKHNLRLFDRGKWNLDKHINYERTPLNKVLVDVPLKDFFVQEFSEAIANSNLKNAKKYKDRVITVDDYYKKYKNHAQETIIQLGDEQLYKNLCETLGQEQADKFYLEALQNAFEKWQTDNPSLKVFGATIHMDEATPHLHLDWLPVAESSRGQKVRVSMDGALRKIGYERKDGNEKWDKAPLKRFLSADGYRQKYEDNFQQFANEKLGEDFLKIIPSDPATEKHKEPWEWRAEEAEKKSMKNIIESFINPKDKAEKLKAAQAIIDNAGKIKKAICDEANKLLNEAKVEMKKATRQKEANEKEAERLATVSSEIDNHKASAEWQEAEANKKLNEVLDRERKVAKREKELSVREANFDRDVEAMARTKATSIMANYGMTIPAVTAESEMSRTADYRQLAEQPKSETKGVKSYENDYYRE